MRKKKQPAPSPEEPNLVLCWANIQEILEELKNRGCNFVVDCHKRDEIHIGGDLMGSLRLAGEIIDVVIVEIQKLDECDTNVRLLALLNAVILIFEAMFGANPNVEN